MIDLNIDAVIPINKFIYYIYFLIRNDPDCGPIVRGPYVYNSNISDWIRRYINPNPKKTLEDFKGYFYYRRYY